MYTVSTSGSFTATWNDGEYHELVSASAPTGGTKTYRLEVSIGGIAGTALVRETTKGRADIQTLYAGEDGIAAFSSTWNLYAGGDDAKMEVNFTSCPSVAGTWVLLEETDVAETLTDAAESMAASATATAAASGAELGTTIGENAAGPKSVTVDGQTVQQHSLAEQIEADKYLAARTALVDPTKAFIRVRLVAPGTV